MFHLHFIWYTTWPLGLRLSHFPLEARSHTLKWRHLLTVKLPRAAQNMFKPRSTDLQRCLCIVCKDTTHLIETMDTEYLHGIAAQESFPRMSSPKLNVTGPLKFAPDRKLPHSQDLEKTVNAGGAAFAVGVAFTVGALTVEGAKSSDITVVGTGSQLSRWHLCWLPQGQWSHSLPGEYRKNAKYRSFPIVFKWVWPAHIPLYWTHRDGLSVYSCGGHGFHPLITPCVSSRSWEVVIGVEVVVVIILLTLWVKSDPWVIQSNKKYHKIIK